MNRPAILIVDDENEIREVLGEVLSESYRVMFAKNGNDAVATVKKAYPDLVLLDLMMPGRDGFSVCRALREDPASADIPIIALSARNEPMSRIEILELGADDFIGKPFHPQELLLRVSKQLQRPRGNLNTTALLDRGSLKTEAFSGSEARLERLCLKLGLREMESRIFCALIQQNGNLITRQDLCEKVWGESVHTDRNLDPHVSSLRKKLEGTDFRVRTTYGKGYLLEVQDTGSVSA